MVCLVKESSKFFCHQEDEVFLINVINETVREDTQTFVDPQSCHGMFCVMEVLVSSQQTLEYLTEIKYEKKM